MSDKALNERMLHIATPAADCECWCHADPQPEYDSYRDYFETHHGTCVDCAGYCGDPACWCCRPQAMVV